MLYNSVYMYVYENNSMLPDRILYNCTLRPMGVFVCCHFCLDAQVFHTAGARVCLFPTKGIQVQEYILGGVHFMKIHTRNKKSRNRDTLVLLELIIRPEQGDQGDQGDQGEVSIIIFGMSES